MTGTTLSLEALNALPASSFVAALGKAFEHADWVAEVAAEGRPYPTVAALHEAMMQAVRTAPSDRLKAFIGGHPELGSRVGSSKCSAKRDIRSPGRWHFAIIIATTPTML